MTDLEKAQADAAFYAEVGPLQVEFEEARDAKTDDPERWFNAKQAFEDQRTYYREIYEYLRAGGDPAPAPETVQEVS